MKTHHIAPYIQLEIILRNELLSESLIDTFLGEVNDQKSGYLLRLAKGHSLELLKKHLGEEQLSKILLRYDPSKLMEDQNLWSHLKSHAKI